MVIFQRYRTFYWISYLFAFIPTLIIMATISYYFSLINAALSFLVVFTVAPLISSFLFLQYKAGRLNVYQIIILLNVPFVIFELLRGFVINPFYLLLIGAHLPAINLVYIWTLQIQKVKITSKPQLDHIVLSIDEIRPIITYRYQQQVKHGSELNIVKSNSIFNIFGESGYTVSIYNDEEEIFKLPFTIVGLDLVKKIEEIFSGTDIITKFDDKSLSNSSKLLQRMLQSPERTFSRENRSGSEGTRTIEFNELRKLKESGRLELTNPLRISGLTITLIQSILFVIIFSLVLILTLFAFYIFIQDEYYFLIIIYGLFFMIFAIMIYFFTRQGIITPIVFLFGTKNFTTSSSEFVFYAELFGFLRSVNITVPYSLDPQFVIDRDHFVSIRIVKPYFRYQLQLGQLTPIYRPKYV